jgi:hypothetical protein
MLKIQCLRFGLAFLLAGSLAACNARQDANLLLNGPPSSFGSKQVSEYVEAQREVVKAITRHAGFGGDYPPDNQWGPFVRAAFDLADQQCEDYMSALRRLDIARRRAMRQTNLVGTATAAILGLTNTASAAIAITATAFGFAEASIDNLAGGLLYELPPGSVRQMVETTRATYEAQLKPANWTDRATAFRTIRGYVELCLPSVIDSQVASAIERAPASATTGSPDSGSRVRITVGDQAAPTSRNTSAGQPVVAPAAVVAAAGATGTYENSLPQSSIRGIQAALCMSLPHDGTFLAPTRRAILAFRQTRPSAVSNPTSDPLTRDEVRVLLAAGPCPAQYRTFFERTALPDAGRIASFQRALNNRLPSVQQIPAESVGTLDAATRAAIAAALPGVGTEGTVTPAVLEAVTR